MAGRNVDEKLRCSFCNKTQDQVKKLIAGPNGAYICDECVGICADILDEEFENEEDVKNSLASPLLEDNLKGLPPACFISAECDPLLDQGLQYAAKLQDAGVKVEYHILKGMLHGFINRTYGKSFEALELAADFVNN